MGKVARRGEVKRRIDEPVYEIMMEFGTFIALATALSIYELPKSLFMMKNGIEEKLISLSYANE